ncbi:zinc finger CCCH domain-containing protein 19-like [Oryza brachyantha]|uniref:C3H1-type domain-containing protein n=1 Tax=Oryza brachyantha TaxID=4533 RepID=J3LIQ6_ORYBR|nr:zinc finger CCCH domain-containing protein 19-like [Oryza brachyantha]
MDSAVRPPPVDEEDARRRRSTDCIYFLASPLTCKKGSECEYRHSDAARVNPRDCWYWFNGNCANPKCSFRHPPLDGLIGAPTTPRTSQQSAPQAQPAQAPVSNPTSGIAKQGVPCYYFQKGMCAKGDRCAFLHLPQTTGNPAPQHTAKVFAPASVPHPQLKNSWTKPNASAQQNAPPATFGRPKDSAHNGKPAQKPSLTNRPDHSTGIIHDKSSYMPSSVTKNYRPLPTIGDDLAENGMEMGEFVREPSAGSDVLTGGADDNAEQSLREDRSTYRRTNGDQHIGVLRQTHGNYGFERSHRSSSEKLLSESRFSHREPMPSPADNSDLRQRLLKQRRLNNPRSGHVSDRHNIYLEDERHDHHRRRGEEQASHDGVSSSRLKGRIKLPAETSFDRLGLQPEKERERGPRARSPPPNQTDLRGKLHDRLKARPNEDVSANVKSSLAKANSGEDADSLNFAGPKSLAELKAKKVVGSTGGHSVKSAGSLAGPVRMTSEIVAVKESSDLVPFDGPKPLDAILKRKREADPRNATDSGNRLEEHTIGDEGSQFQNNEEDIVGTNTEGNEEAYQADDDLVYGDSMSPADDIAAETADDARKELEEQQNTEPAEEYDYEMDDVNAEDENDYQEYEDDDLEDDDDFARKVGVMIS